jgi:hypothetical protein
MTQEEQTPQAVPGGAGMNPRYGRYVDKLTQGAILGLPVLLLQMLWEYVGEYLTAQPWHVLCFVVPLIGIGVVAVKAARGQQDLVLKGGLRIAFIAYVLVFTLASASDLLVWHRDLTVFGQRPGRHWLVPARWGDWRYSMIPKESRPAANLIVLTMEPSPPRARRYDISRLVGLAGKKQCKGIAFDFFFKENIEDVDGLLRAAVEAFAREVFIGYIFQRVDGQIRRLATASNIEEFLRLDKKQGHLVGLLEPDQRVRLIPLYFHDDKELPSLSLRIGKHIATTQDDDLELPSDGLLRYVKPEAGVPQYTFDEFTSDPNKHSLLTDSWVIVGEDSPEDTVLTPYGKLPGVLVHAYAVHSLLHGRFIRPTPWWSSVLMILLSCYLLLTLRAGGASRLKIVGAGVLFSLAIVGISIGALVIWFVWIDVVYALAAIWLLVLILGAGRKPEASGSHRD